MIPTACFTGHRPKDLKGYNPEDNKELLWRLHDTIVDHIVKENVMVFINGGCIGIDLWAAQIVLKLKSAYSDIRLWTYVPCKEQSKLWTKRDKELYNNILEKSDFVVNCSTEDYHPGLMQERNVRMLNDSQYLIAVWSGKEKGGTYNCITAAKKKDIKITTVEP